MVMLVSFVNVFWLCIFSDTVRSSVLFSSTSPQFTPFSKDNIIFSTNVDIVSSFNTYLAPKYAWTKKSFIMADPLRKNGLNQEYDSDMMPIYVTPGHLVYWKYLGKSKVFYILNDYLSMLCQFFPSFFHDLAVVDGAIHATFDPSQIDHISHLDPSMPPIPVYPFSYFLNDDAVSIVCLFSTMEIEAEDRKWLLRDSESVDGTAILLPLRAFQQLLHSSSLMTMTMVSDGSMTLKSPFSTSMDEIKQALGCYALSTFIYNQTTYKVLQTSYGLWFNDVGLENPFSFSSNNQESSYILLGDRSRRWILRYRDSSEYFSLSSQEMVDAFSCGTHFANFDDGIPSIVKKPVVSSYSLGFCQEWSKMVKYFDNTMVKRAHYTDGSIRYVMSINGEIFNIPTTLMLKYFTARRLVVDDEGVIQLTKNALPLLADLGFENVSVGVPMIGCNDLVMHKVEYAPLGDWHHKKSNTSNIEKYCAYTRIRGCRFWIVKADDQFVFIPDREMIIFSDVHRFFNSNIVIDSNSYLVINNAVILSSFMSRVLLV